MSELEDDLAALRIERGPDGPGGRRWVWGLVVVLVLAAGAAAGWRWLTRARPVSVQVASTTERAAGTQAAVLNASGYVTARRRATVSSKVTGKVVEVDVEEGMAVKAGQVLARLDDASARAAAGPRAGAARSGAAEPGRKRRPVAGGEGHAWPRPGPGRGRAGHAGGSRLGAGRRRRGGGARRPPSASRSRSASRQVDVQRAELDNTVIRAPFSGIAISKDAQPGEMVSPVSAGGGFTRTGICTIVDMQSLEIEVDVNESYINRVSPGQAVTAVLDAYPDWQIPGHVITTIPAADRQKATVLVRIGFERLDPRILPDMGVKVTFLRPEDATAPEARQPTTLVPRDAVRKDGSAAYVFVVHGDTVERRAVQTGGVDGDRLEVRAGLQGGERVVVSPPPALADGATVTVQ